MKTKIIVLNVAVIISALAAFAANTKNLKTEDPAADSYTIMKATIKSADSRLEVIAGKIQVEEGTKGISIVRCSGEVTIRSGTRTIEGKDITIKLGAGDSLSILMSDASVWGKQMPNQAPEPTPTAVTPPAGQEARQP